MTGRGIVGRRLARLILVATLAVDALVGAFLLNPPSDIGPMVAEPHSALVAWLVLALGVTLNVVGIVWMSRILSADPEARASSSRAVRGR
jgi:hypothetical protein